MAPYGTDRSLASWRPKAVLAGHPGRSRSYAAPDAEKGPSRHLGKQRQIATTSTPRFPANQILTLRFRALLNEEFPEVELPLT